ERAGDARQAIPRPIALPPGAFDTDAVSEITDPDGWGRVAGLDPDRIPPYDDARRLVLVGPRSPAVDCTGAEVIATDDVWVIRFRPAAEPSEATACLFLLPRDGRRSRVVVDGSAP
ncbi:MAG TPA: hypothetical protein VD788_04040, partial [Candidatus Polarisedimenticolaceae bacterium]|nr:hypothetical protein [Candidatus Polarisedimenticolaceae bacterium]